MDQKARMRGPEFANGVESIGVEMTWFDQPLECQQQVRVRNNNAGIDAIHLLRVSGTGVYLDAASSHISDEYPINVRAHQNVAAEFFEAQRQLIRKSL